MSIVVGVLLALAAFVFVAVPFFRSGADGPVEDTGDVDGDRIRWERQKVEAYTAIKDAEFDYRMDKLSDGDFAALKERYSAQALAALEALEAASRGRAGGTGRRPAKVAFCPACGHAAAPRANFCAACGRGLREAVA